MRKIFWPRSTEQRRPLCTAAWRPANSLSVGTRRSDAKCGKLQAVPGFCSMVLKVSFGVPSLSPPTKSQLGTTTASEGLLERSLGIVPTETSCREIFAFTLPGLSCRVSHCLVR